MEHYFINKDHTEKDFFNFNFNYRDRVFKFNSSPDVFSKAFVDEGSQVLADAVIKNFKLSGNVLDMGCGYGAIAVLLANNFPKSTFTLCDINKTAVMLAKRNAEQNNLKNIKYVFVSDMFENVSGVFDAIVSNPPIKSGKKKLNEFLENSFSHLTVDGIVVIVIKKNLGANSAKKKLTDIFGNCTVIKRHRGYYVLCSKKGN